MATLLLSAAGAAVGSGFGGSVLGLSGAVIGRAVGATIGRSLDQHLIGAGSDAVETGKVERFRFSGTGYGTPIQEVWGRMRIAGEVIWASRFQENRQDSGGGKGTARNSSSRLTYTVSLAIALCRGEVLRVGRIWADGVEISPNILDLRFYTGDENQMPDPKIEAVEGVGFAPSYRGISYVVIENLDLNRFGNRVPQFSFEIVRQANVDASKGARDMADVIRAVSLIPGTGEYALATTPVHFDYGLGRTRSANVRSVLGESDFNSSFKQLSEELPNCESVSLVISWFGNDLRCNHCKIQPKVEQRDFDGVGMPWVVSGTPRSAAEVVPPLEGKPVYGGTPCDRSVIESIQAIRATGKEVMFYPFILMEQLPGNDLPDPWSESTTQPSLPWRGRITLSKAPGTPGSPDQTTQAQAELDQFLGNASPEDFTQAPNEVNYTGPADWGYRRFILHYANLCAIAGGVDAFCIGSEMRGLTQIRGPGNSFPMVTELKTLAAEVRQILGSATKISYAADWSEYFGYHTSGDVFFNMDPLWSDPNIDFIGIDNYMPVSDWKDGPGNLDSAWGTIHDQAYITANISAGEGFDWYYESAEAAESQRRSPIVDQAYGEHWVFRFKDLKSWWSNSHYERLNGTRSNLPTQWIPGIKPFRFTEYGCASIDKGTNQPNRFLDPKSSESALPRNSTGHRDDLIQLLYFLAMEDHWSQEINNPAASLYAGKMVDASRSHAWAWDARPFPEFPGSESMGSDGENYGAGHWINGKSSSQLLSKVVTEVCRFTLPEERLVVQPIVKLLRGFQSNETVSARAKLQTLSHVFGLLAIEVNGDFQLGSTSIRSEGSVLNLDSMTGPISVVPKTWSASALEGRIQQVRLTYIQAEGSFETQVATSSVSDLASGYNADSESSILLTSFEAYEATDRWLSEVSQLSETIRLVLPKSNLDWDPGKLFLFEDSIYEIQQVDESDVLSLDVRRTTSHGSRAFSKRGLRSTQTLSIPATSVFCRFLDLPLLREGEVEHAPHVAISASPWLNSASVWSSISDEGFVLNTEVTEPSVIGITRSAVYSTRAEFWDFGSSLIVEVAGGSLTSSSRVGVLSGLNLAAIGDGSTQNWEVIQFLLASLIGENTYELRGLLRGIAGTDALMPPVWPVGSQFILLDDRVRQIELPYAARGLERFYRVGATAAGPSDSRTVLTVASFDGIGLRPLSVVHLRYLRDLSGGIAFSWIRRTRIDGDSWASFEVPLGEELEEYKLTIRSGAAIARVVYTTEPGWVYTVGMQESDSIGVPFEVEVSQVSNRFGPGPAELIIVDW